MTSTRAAFRRPIDFPERLRRPLQAREPQALEAFFDSFCGPIYDYVAKLLGRAPVAEDVTQEVFAQIYERLESYDPELDPRPWAFTIATNQVRQYFRYAGVRRAVQTSEEVSGGGAQEPAARGEGPLSILAAKETRRHLRAAVEALPLGMREPVLLRAYEGLSFEDIARVLELSTMAVRKRYSRAMTRLREILIQAPTGAAEDPA